MALQLKFFVIPILGIEQVESEINAFLRSLLSGKLAGVNRIAKR